MPQSKPGTYVLVLRSERREEIAVGSWGSLRVEPGYYLYVGSAFGPGGVQARVGRHLRKSKPRRWHIDYLRELTVPVSVWCSYAPDRLEHEWAHTIGEVAGVSCIRGFGSSDCRCAGHLFVTSDRPDATNWRIPAAQEVPARPQRRCHTRN
jgi:Uri superfamily endonuclease